MALTANQEVDRLVDQELRQYGLTASAHVYKGGFVGLAIDGYVRAFVAGDLFLGLAYEEGDNTSGANGDVKPSNVMMAMQNGAAAPKVIDFGVANAINQRLTEHTLYTRFAHMGDTPMYMSPEQAQMGLDRVAQFSSVDGLGGVVVEGGFDALLAVASSRTPSFAIFADQFPGHQWRWLIRGRGTGPPARGPIRRSSRSGIRNQT